MAQQTIEQPKLIHTKKGALSYKEKTLIMGILNVTPDSFSDGGKYDSTERALLHAAKMAEEGAHIIDIGGESTRPGASLVSADEEMSRVIPVIERITSELDIPLSIDTYKASVADEAVKAGASILNDIWGAKGDPDMASVAAAHGVPIILMHNRMERNYNDLIPDMLADLMESVKIAAEAGVTDENMILDPGIGFAKNYEDNLAVMNKLEVFSGLGYPLLLATSRKRFIGRVLDLPPEERAEGTGATVCLGVQKGCDIVRVHDVKEIARMTKMMDAMLNKGGAHYG
ncbi:dihydropteroate synthase [Bacillus sp. ChL18]|uniref:dihydropteroate synthase n=1 Tax=Bacillus TaxID=1386 RepID=UPI0009F4868F|nr:MULTISPECIES: dihydropteroate synthase [Bacillus]MCX2812299.1 dihydropteroate synthase [Bacillus sp. ChL18]MDL5025571.1 dihydropteroate synthase [Bacillus velezensis]MEC3613440.1 dihydropteroate synthase [Bacillus velezensis]MEC3677294.1 dihydropteroate synthase [Bacillus velezensis]OQV45920.1 dihydropteroate synthase [Bacillus velezensis]